MKALLMAGLLFLPPGVLSQFQKDMEAVPLAAQIIEPGVAGLRAVEFVSDAQLGNAAAMYVPALREIKLNQNLQDSSTGGLKSLATLSPGDAGIIVHELWHSDFHVHPEMKGQVNAGIEQTYAQIPSTHREEVQDEAYGLFIQKIVTAYLTYRHIQQTSAPETWARLKVNPQFIANYEIVFSEPCYGYYQSGLLTRRLVWSTEALAPEHKAFVLSALLGGRLTGRFSSDF